MDTLSLAEISAALQAHIHDREALVYASVDTGYDETGLTATADGYLRLARELIDFVAAAQRGEHTIYTYGEVQGPGSSAIGSVFSSLSDVELDSTMLVQTEAQAEQAVRYFRAKSAPE